MPLSSHYAFLPIILLQPMPIPFDSISLLHQITICTSLFTLDCPFLLSTFHSILPIPFQFHCLVPCPTSQYLSPFLTIFNYIASLIHNATICSPFPLSIFQLSVSFLLVVLLYIYLGSYHPLIHLSSHWLTIVLLSFLYSSECSSCSYWLIPRLSPLYESDSIATPLCIYTYYE